MIRESRLAIALSLVVLLAACAGATPAFKPGGPRNGFGQPVDPVYGTPLPGSQPTGG
jgi:hypothetical protein